MAGQVALITGASRGIGRATALELARRGAHCVVTARTVGALEELDDDIRAGGGTATLLPLDLTDGPALDQLGPSLAARFGRLDLLVHAAACLGVLTPVGHIRERDWSAVMAVNLTAGWRLLRTVAPLLERAPAGRAVVLTDGHADRPEPFWGLMAASKAGLAALVRTWALECASRSALRVMLHDPGPTATRLRAQAMPGEDVTSVPSADQAALQIVTLCLPHSAA
nr:SDR family oxidoreductase [Ameyamaea chiangmaiensis]